MNSNVSFIVGLYSSVLDRAADTEGLNNWVAALDSGAMTRDQVVASFFDSAEFQALSPSGMNANVSFIVGLYLGLLDRIPDPDGLKNWGAALDSGATTREHVVTSFFNSAEFQARSNSADLHEIVRDLYSNAFNNPFYEGRDVASAQIDAGVQMDKIVIDILSVVDDPKNADGQRLQNAIEATLSASSIYQKAGVKNFWVATELDSITADQNSVAMFNYQVQQSVGVNAPAPAVIFDNVIKGDDFPGNTDLNGTNLNDYIILGRNTQFVSGKDGDDQFIGTKTNTTFYPGAGNDTVEAGGGSDTIDARNDAAASRRDSFYAQDGNDTVYGGASDEFIDGGDGDDLINTGAGKDVVRGGIGNDTIIKSGAGEFNFLGEAGDDTIIIDAISRGQIYGDAGNDTIHISQVTGWQIWAGSGNDVVTANSGNYSLADLGDGNDRITLSNLHDVTIHLGNGDDIVELNNCHNVKVYGGYGKDTFRVTNSSNLMLIGENDEDSFFVDAVSLETGTVKLRGWTEEREYYPGFNDFYLADPYTTPNNLTITSLNNGDNITFNDDNYRALSNIKFDYSQHATITFDNVPGLGLWTYKWIGYFHSWRWQFDVNDIFGIQHNTINSEIILKNATPFEAEGDSFSNMFDGDWWAREYLSYLNGTTPIRTQEVNHDIYFHNLNSPVPLLGHVKSIDGYLHLFGNSNS